MNTEQQMQPAIIDYKNLDDILKEFNSQDDHPPLIIVLSDRSDSNWVKEGTENTPNPEKMNFPGLYRISPTSQIAFFKDEAKKNYTLKPIRYIIGCPSLDPEWQDANGFAPDINHDNIWVVNGTETFLREGNTVALYDYIKLYQGNCSNPHRPPTAEDEFEEIIERDEAEKGNVVFETKFEAMALIKGLRKALPGNKGFEYDEERLALFTRLFVLEQYEYPEEKFQALAVLVEESPDVIINTIANHKKGVFATVKQGMDLNVIILEKDKVYFSETNTVILATDNPLAQKTLINKLVDLLITDEGSVFLKQIYLSVDKAMDKLATE